MIFSLSDMFSASTFNKCELGCTTGFFFLAGEFMSMQSLTDWVPDVCAFSSSFASNSKNSDKKLVLHTAICSQVQINLLFEVLVSMLCLTDIDHSGISCELFCQVIFFLQ